MNPALTDDCPDPMPPHLPLPHVWKALRRLARRRVAGRTPGQTDAGIWTARDAFLCLVSPADRTKWGGPRRFFAAAAEANRQRLVEAFRRSLMRDESSLRRRFEDLLALDRALARLEAKHPAKAELVKLRYFAGLTSAEAAQMLGLSPAAADGQWAYAKAWLYADLTVDGRGLRGP